MAQARTGIQEKEFEYKCILEGIQKELDPIQLELDIKQ